jgi:hypothetical protein
MTWFFRSKRSSPHQLTRTNKQSSSRTTRLQLETLEDRTQPAVTITLDYSLDTSGFFQDQTRRNALQAAVNAIAVQLNDNLTAIIPGGQDTWMPEIFDPSTGNSRVLNPINVQTNEIRIYVGARSLAGAEAGEGATGGAFRITGSDAWINRVLHRGQGNTIGTSARDFGPWGGSIAFDLGSNWYFGTTPGGIQPGQVSFVSVAQHELGHVLGFGTADSYDNIAGTTTFPGQFSIASFGSPVPLASDGDHWDQTVRSNGKQASMTPVIQNGTFTSFTALDFAGLADIGWQVTGINFGTPGGGGGGGGDAPGGVRGQHITVVGTEAGSVPHVKVYNFDGTLRFSFYAYSPNVLTGVRVATGDITGDGFDDIITAAGAGGGPHIKVFDGRSGAQIRSFFAYNPTFSLGVFVASGDVNGDGRADIITGPGAGGGPHVKVFSGANGAEIRSFFAYGSNYFGGVNVAAGDLNRDGRAEIITGTGAGSVAHVKGFNGLNLGLLRNFYAYSPLFNGGVFVASGDVNADGFADIITVPGPSGGPQVNIFNGRNATLIKSFYAGSPTQTSGLRVAAKDVNNDGRADIVTSVGPGASPTLAIYNSSGGLLSQFLAYSSAFTGGFFVG